MPLAWHFLLPLSSWHYQSYLISVSYPTISKSCKSVLEECRCMIVVSKGQRHCWPFIRSSFQAWDLTIDKWLICVASLLSSIWRRYVCLFPTNGSDVWLAAITASLSPERDNACISNTMVILGTRTIPLQWYYTMARWSSTNCPQTVTSYDADLNANERWLVVIGGISSGIVTDNERIVGYMRYNVNMAANRSSNPGHIIHGML